MRSCVKARCPSNSRVGAILPGAFLLYFLVGPYVSSPYAPSLGVAAVPIEAASTEENDAAASSVVPTSKGLSLYDDAAPMLWMSRLTYSFAALLKEGRSGNFAIPSNWMEEFKDKRFDVRFLNGNHGLPFSEIFPIIEENKEHLGELTKSYFGKFELSLFQNLKAIEDMRPNTTTLFLETFDSIQQKTECVYGIMKDEHQKKIIISFRGSKTKGTKDWSRNIQAQMTTMRTPKLLKSKLEGRLKDNILVHKGFYEYIFNNTLSDRKQRYDQIIDDIKPLVEDGYEIYVTGHSLGAALGSLLAFKLAGSNKAWIPKPITCISFESPFVGGAEFRTAFKELEKEGLIRYLRVTNKEDPVPALPPVSLGRVRPFKHVGIHLNLHSNKYDITYTRDDNRRSRAWHNNILSKNLLRFYKYHGLELVDDRMNKYKEALNKLTLSGLYQNKDITGDSFFGGSDEL